MSESNGKATSKVLQELIGRINTSHTECLTAVRQGLTFAVRTGNLLIKAREEVQAGGEEWLPWVEENCKFSKSQAQRYIRIADGYHKLKDTTENPEELSLTEALRLLRGAGGKAAKKEKDDRIVVTSERAKQEMIARADHVRLADHENGREFIRQQAKAIASRVLRLIAKKSPTNAAGEPIDSATAAVVVLKQIKEELDPSLVVRAEADASPDPEIGASRRGHNRLNGKQPALAK